jgi:hypothetical protein
VTTTPRLGLTKPATSDAYNIGVANGNMDLLDAAPANVTICTSATRPSTPDDGDLIYETDSTNILVRQSGAWKSFNAKVQICTSATRPSSALSFGGMIIYETDTLHLLVRNAGNSAWLSVIVQGTPTTKQYFFSTGTWTKPVGCIAIDVEVQGGGGGSGGIGATGVSQTSLSGGAGGGGYSRKAYSTGALAATETVTVGAGGSAGSSGGTTGGTGGNSSFATGKAYVTTANGGFGSTGSAAGAGSGTLQGGLGGSASGGDLNIPGGAGGNGVYSASLSMGTGYGGASILSTPVMTDGSGVPQTGHNYGGGAAGAFNGASASARAGSAGAPGVVIVTEYY